MLYKVENILVLLMLCISSLLITSCKKENTSNLDEDIYIPSSTLTTEEISALIQEAKTNLANAPQVAITEIHNQDNGTNNKYTISVNANSKQRLSCSMDASGNPLEFSYMESGREYIYKNESGVITKKSRKVAESKSRFSILAEQYFPENYKFRWQVQGALFIGHSDFSSLTASSYLTTLTASKKFHTIILRDEFHPSDFNITESKFLYVSNPTMPAGFERKDFTEELQYEVNIVWNEGKGESTFFTGEVIEGEGMLDLDEIRECAPAIAGKQPQFCFDPTLQSSIPIDVNYLLLTKANNTLYVKWITASN